MEGEICCGLINWYGVWAGLTFGLTKAAVNTALIQRNDRAGKIAR